MVDATTLRTQLRDYAVGLPGAYEDFPWEESVVKVNKKIFVFLGVEDSEQYPPTVGVKLRDSHDQALRSRVPRRRGTAWVGPGGSPSR